MAEERVQRRLAAILAADVVGYSRLKGVNGKMLSIAAFAVAGPEVVLALAHLLTTIRLTRAYEGRW